MRWRQAGFSLLELAVMSVILAILAAVLLQRLTYYQEVAEKMNMEATVSTLKSALFLKIAEYMTAGRRIDYEQLARENPMDWLEVKPPNYAGPFSGDAPETMPLGNWHYDRSERTLVYRVNNGRYFVPDSQGRKQVRLRLVLSYGEIWGGVGLRDSPKQASGIKLMAVEPYRWFAP